MSTQLQSQSTGIGEKPCLLVVDATRGFTDPLSPLGADYPRQIEVIGNLMRHSQLSSWPCFLTTVIYRSETTASVFRKKLPALNCLTPASKWVAIDPRLPELDNSTIVEKSYASAFFGTDLGQCLKSQDIDTVIVTGFTTSGCVRASAVDALQWNFRVVVVKDAVGDRSDEAHDANLHDLALKYADVVGSDEILALSKKNNLHSTN